MASIHHFAIRKPFDVLAEGLVSEQSRADTIWTNLPLRDPLHLGAGRPTASLSTPLPIFLSETRDIPAPLETTYREASAVFPDMLKELIEPTGT